MGVIRVRESGLFTTVQDLGREGFAFLGVSAYGSAYAISLRLGNRLLGNAEGAAGLELPLLGGTFIVPQVGTGALTGSDFGATLDGERVDLWTTFAVKPGQTLRLGPTCSGARCYLCVEGGIAVEPFLGSASTHVLSGLGGFEGRALRKGDRLELGAASPLFPKRTLAPKMLERLQPRKIIRVTGGPQSDWFADSAWQTFCESAFRVSEQSNRMGIRL